MGENGHPEVVSMPVAIQRYFDVALFLMLLTGFGTLASTGTLDLPTVGLAGAALLFRGYLLARREVWLIPEKFTSSLTLAYVAFYLVDYFLISGAFLSATVHLVLFVMIVRLFSAQRDRDYYFLAVLAFLMVLAGAVLTVDSIFMLAFAAFLLVAVITFILMEMRHGASHAGIQGNPPPNAWAHRHMAFSLGGAAPALVALILAGAAVIFFLLPRFSGGYFSAYTPSHELSTGFSDHVQLGGIGQIQQSHSVVMHIQIDGDHRGDFDLKWRGITLNVFDGRTWSNPREKFRVPQSLGGAFTLPPNGLSTAFAGREEIRYRVLMEPVGVNVFFLTPHAESLEGNYRLVTVDGGGSVYDIDLERQITAYEGISNIARPRAEELRSAMEDYPPAVLLDYLQLPALDRRIPALAKQITALQANNYDRAEALERYLKTHFGYTLQLSRTTPRDPLAEFLFERKQGHCEYFASAMVVMLRTLHIPARVVNGFQAGEFNDITEQYVIRASDAHSWVEAYFPGYGWVSFDPTPSGGGVRTATGWGRVMLYLDAASSFWREWVVNYDFSHQNSLVKQTTRSGKDGLLRLHRWSVDRYQAMLDAARRTQRTVTRSPRNWTAGGVAATILILLAANLRRIWRGLVTRRAAASPRTNPTLAASIWYGRMIQRMEKMGWRKLPGQTPQEFNGQIGNATIRQRVETFTRSYESARFGGSADEAERLPELYEEIAGSSRR